VLSASSSTPGNTIESGEGSSADKGAEELAERCDKQLELKRGTDRVESWLGGEAKVGLAALDPPKKTSDIY